MSNDNRSDASVKNLNQVIKIDQEQVQSHLGEMVRSTVQQTLNQMLDAEADQLCQARRYERSPDRADTRAGHYKRQLHTISVLRMWGAYRFDGGVIFFLTVSKSDKILLGV